MWQQIPAVPPFPGQSQLVLSGGAATSLWHVGCLQAAPHAAQLRSFADSEHMQKGNSLSLLYEIRVMRMSFPWGKEKDGGNPTA